MASDPERERLQGYMAQIINDVLDQKLAPNNQLVKALWELVEQHYAGKCTEHEQQARADERAKLADELDTFGWSVESLRALQERLMSDEKPRYQPSDGKPLTLAAFTDLIETLARGNERDAIVAYLGRAADTLDEEMKAEPTYDTHAADALRIEAGNISGNEHRRKA